MRERQRRQTVATSVTYNADCLPAMRDENNLDFVGYEIDKTYYALQEQRFQNYADQFSLFRMEE